MENSLTSQQEFSLLLNEINVCLDKMDQSQKTFSSALAILSPYFNLKNPQLTFDAAFDLPWKNWKQSIKAFMQALRQSEAAYQDLSGQMQNLLGGRSPQDPLHQALLRQGGALLKDLQKRQDLSLHLIELEQVLDRLRQQEKVSSPQKQKIEDLVFRLQLLF